MSDSKQAVGLHKTLFQAAVTGDEDELLEYIHDGYDINEMAEYDDGESDGPVSALMLASRNGHQDFVQILLDFGADISQLDQLYTKALVVASRRKDGGSLRRLAVAGLFKEAEIELYQDLLVATHQRDFDNIHQLLDNRAGDGGGTTSSTHSTRTRAKVDELCLCILAGAPVSRLESLDLGQGSEVINGYNSRGFTPLIAAVLSAGVFGGGDVAREEDWIDVLILRGADVDRPENVAVVMADLECSRVDDDDQLIDAILPAPPVGPHPLNSNTKSPLVFAIWTGMLDVVQHVLRLKPKMELYDSQIKTPLVHAMYEGSAEIVKILLSHGADVNKIDYDPETPIFHSVYTGKLDMVKMIGSLVADINSINKSGSTPFLVATESNRADMLEVMWKTGKIDDIDGKGKTRLTPLMLAAVNGHLDCVRFLIQAGADVKASNRWGMTAVEMAAEKGLLACVKLFAEMGGGGGEEDSKGLISHYGDQFIHAAAQSRSSDTLEFCLKGCTDINALNSNDETPLMCAAMEGVVGNVQLLLDSGANVKFKNNAGSTAIVDALENDNFSCFQLLLQAGADVNIVPEDRDTPLVLAAQSDNIKFLELLLDQDSHQINTVSKNSGKTPLISAIKNGKADFVDLLLSHKADTNIGDKSSCTPLMYAVKKNLPHVVKTLLEAGADVNAVDEDDCTVIWDAVYWWQCLQLLLEGGGMVDADGDLKTVHTESGIEWGLQWDSRCLKLFFEYNVFEWDWYVSAEQEDQIHKISFAAVSGGNCPALFKAMNGQTTSLLQDAFLVNNHPTARYLLANKYFTIEDYSTITTNRVFQQKVREAEDIHPETVSLLDSVTSQPWKLETLSFLVVSSALRASTKVQRRAHQVDALPLPEIFKAKLKFQEPVHKLCPSVWKEHLPTNGTLLLSLANPSWAQNLAQCGRAECSCCGNLGFLLTTGDADMDL